MSATINDLKRNEGLASHRQLTAVTSVENSPVLSRLYGGESEVLDHGKKFPLQGFSTINLYSYVVDEDLSDDATYTGVSFGYKLYRFVDEFEVYAEISSGSVTLTDSTYTASTNTVAPGSIAISDSSLESATHISFSATVTAPAGAKVLVELSKKALAL